jgi:phosphate transport system permease protein
MAVRALRIRPAWPRKLANRIVLMLSCVAALLGILILAWILVVVVREGAQAVDWDFFTKRTAPPGVEGGMGNAILGTVILVVLAVVFGVPTGMLAGVYLSEFGRRARLGALIRFSTNVMMGIPSIIVGLFVYTIVVVPMGHGSAWAGAIALALLMLPVVSRTTEDILQLVPNDLRESALALGAPRWRATLQIVFRAARSGLITGVLLAVARISGETAPLLFTCMNSDYWPNSFNALNSQMANLTVTIYNRFDTPFPELQRMAWGGCLVITVSVLCLNIFARVLIRKPKA